MSRKVQFVTPENIEVSYELAGIGSRFVAAFVDHLIQILIILSVSLIASYLIGGAMAIGRITGGGSIPLYIQAIAGLVIFVIVFGYFTAFELFWHGRTPGKRIAGLRVVRDGGYPIDFYSSLIRNLVRIIDIIPSTYGIGIVSVFLSSDYKRLGDYAAGTIVIKERPPTPLTAREHKSASPAVAHFMPMVKNVDLLTSEEFQAIHRFIQRRHDLSIPVQAHFAMRLAFPILEKLRMEPTIHAQIHYADLLEAIDRCYIEDRGVL